MVSRLEATTLNHYTKLPLLGKRSLQIKKTEFTIYILLTHTVGTEIFLGEHCQKWQDMQTIQQILLSAVGTVKGI